MVYLTYAVGLSLLFLVCAVCPVPADPRTIRAILRSAVFLIVVAYGAGHLSSPNQSQPQAELSAGSADATALVVCTGEHEASCPKLYPHQIFLECDYFGTDQQIAHGIFGGNARAVRLATVSGNRCGYSLIAVTRSMDPSGLGASPPAAERGPKLWPILDHSITQSGDVAS